MGPVTMNSQEKIKISATHWKKMREHVASLAPEEACGLAAGLNGVVLEVYPITNLLHSPVRYRMEPQEQFKVLQEIDRLGWELLAIYHSHPEGPAFPSPTDIAEAYYPEAIYIIWSPDGGTWSGRGFKIDNHQLGQAVIEQA